MGSAAVLGIGLAAPTVSFDDSPSGCDLAATGTTESCTWPLSGSTFAGGDGNLPTTPTAVGSQDETNLFQANISLKPNDIVTCTSVNKLPLRAIKITKTGKNKAAGSGDRPLAGAKFSITGPNNSSSTATAGSDGTVCVDSLPFGSYTVTETDPPPRRRWGRPTRRSPAWKPTANPVASPGSGFVDPATASATGLTPGTHTCTILIDP